MTIALLAYIGYIVIFAILNLAIFYHIVKYSYPGDASRPVFFIYLLIVTGIIILTFSLAGIS